MQIIIYIFGVGRSSRIWNTLQDGSYLDSGEAPKNFRPDPVFSITRVYLVHVWSMLAAGVGHSNLVRCRAPKGFVAT
jgi:hypothetical protein